MHVLILRPYRKDNIYFRTIEEREKINTIYLVYVKVEIIDQMCLLFCGFLLLLFIFLSFLRPSIRTFTLN